MVRDQVLRLLDELHELADPAIAAPELYHSIHKIAKKPKDPQARRRDRMSPEGTDKQVNNRRSETAGFDALGA